MEKSNNPKFSALVFILITIASFLTFYQYTLYVANLSFRRLRYGEQFFVLFVLFELYFVFFLSLFFTLRFLDINFTAEKLRSPRLPEEKDSEIHSEMIIDSSKFTQAQILNTINSTSLDPDMDQPGGP